MLSTGKHLLILTVEEIHVYDLKLEADGRFTLSPYTPLPLSTDRTRYLSIFQCEKSKRLFLGGHLGQVSELYIDGVTAAPSSGSKSKNKVIQFVSQLADRVIKKAS